MSDGARRIRRLPRRRSFLEPSDRAVKGNAEDEAKGNAHRQVFHQDAENDAEDEP